MPRTIPRTLLVAALLTALAVPDAQAADPAPADSKATPAPDTGAPARAEAMRVRGARLCAEEKGEEGVRVLKDALRLDPAPTIAAELGACELDLKRYPEAADHLAQAIRGLPQGDTGNQLGVWRELYDKAHAKVAALRIKVDVAGADVFAGKRLVGQSPLPGDVHVEPGEIVVAARTPAGAEDKRTVRVTAGGGATLSLSPKAVADRDRFERKAGPSPWPAVGLAVVGAGLGVVGIVEFTQASKKASDADTMLADIRTAAKAAGQDGTAPCSAAKPDARCAELKDLRAQRDKQVDVGAGLAIAGGALLAGGIAYAVWAFGLPASDTRRRYAIAPVVTPNSAGLWAVGSF